MVCRNGTPMDVEGPLSCLVTQAWCDVMCLDWPARAYLLYPMNENL